MTGYETFETGAAPIKAWVKGVPLDDGARRQLENIARLPFIHDHVAAMPDVHLGKGATIGSVIATRAAIIPAAVRRRYRLRHDGDAHQHYRRGSAGEPGAAAHGH